MANTGGITKWLSIYDIGSQPHQLSRWKLGSGVHSFFAPSIISLTTLELVAN